MGVTRTTGTGEHQPRASAGGPRVLSPLPVMSAAAAVTLALGVLCLMLSMRQSWLGLELERAPAASEAPRIVGGPAAAALGNAELVALLAKGERIVLRSDDLVPEPDLVFLDYAGYEAFLGRQQRLAQALQAPILELELGDGRRIAMQGAARRPVGDLPFEFWLQLAAGLASLLAGGGLIAFRPADPAVRACVLAGVGTALAACTAAVYTTRELALSGELFAALAAINHLGACLASAAFVSTLWLYPRPLTRRAPTGALLLGSLCWWLAEQARVLPTGVASTGLLVVLAFAVALVLAVLQWRRTRGDLRERAALRWLLLSWLGGSAAFVFLVLVPSFAGQDTGDVLPYAFGTLLLTLLGLTLGVARYRLFDLELWSFRALLLIGGGFAVLGLDLALVSLLHLGQPMALGVSLLVAGWMYFPARQWLSQRLFAGARDLQISEVPTLLRDVLVASDDPPDQLLPDTLKRLFRPLHLERIAQMPTAEPTLVDDGLGLQVPGIGPHAAWELRLAAHGQRLFNRRDVSLAAAVLAVLERFLAHQTAIERSVEQERARVAQDLHDDVGARLLTLLHRSQDETADAIRDTLESLRHTVYALGPDSRSLPDALASLRAEAADRCEAAAVALHWNERSGLPISGLKTAQLQDLMRVLREAISNALRHSRATQLSIELWVDAARLHVLIENDGAQTAPETWREGVGLRGLRTRMLRLGGGFVLEGERGRVRLRLTVPLAADPLPGGRT